ncbi:unnamed protein product [Schistosoma margrebowiei]|uniref:Sulfhydryl oxidase n=1 Tax=Schistosoma margrebowiei TaxID=48269 RepID=A0A183LYC6_9TREM|nr:unnamed protein product [Schistosoma margrebowiei]
MLNVILIGFCFYSECPPDKIELGKATWTLLHTMAAYYPIHPTLKQQEDMKKFLQIFPQFFPCRPCAYDFESSLIHKAVKQRQEMQFHGSRSIIDEHGGSDADMKARIGKARAAYLQLKSISKSKQLTTNTKVTIFNTNVKTRQSITSNPQGQRRRARPKNTSRREMETDMRRMSNNWTELGRKTQDRVGWRMLVGGLCSIGVNRR